MFARAEYDPSRPSVDAVLDSSRYFVVRVEDAGRKAYIGMGFAERSDSFDFSEPRLLSCGDLLPIRRRRGAAGLHEVYISHFRIKRFLTSPRRYKARLNPGPEPESPQVPAEPKKDYSLKEGQTFSIALPGRSKASTTGPSLLGSSGSCGPSTGGGIPLLPPPPSAPKKH